MEVDQRRRFPTVLVLWMYTIKVLFWPVAKYIYRYRYILMWLVLCWPFAADGTLQSKIELTRSSLTERGTESDDKAAGPGGGAVHGSTSGDPAFSGCEEAEEVRPVHMGVLRRYLHEPLHPQRRRGRGVRDDLRHLRFVDGGAFRASLPTHDTAHRVQEPLVRGVRLRSL